LHHWHHWHLQLLESQKAQRDEEFKAVVATHDVEVQELKKQLKVVT
jgi:hypothetical protein